MTHSDRQFMIGGIVNAIAQAQKSPEPNTTFISFLEQELQSIMNKVCPVIKQNEKQHIELNGVANMLMILDNKEGNDLFEIQMRDQLDLLERYLLAFAEAFNDNRKIPFWHEINQNPMRYPTLKEKRNKGK